MFEFLSLFNELLKHKEILAAFIFVFIALSIIFKNVKDVVKVLRTILIAYTIVLIILTT
jgi:hypothetical protein